MLHKTVQSEVADALRARILSGDLKPGTWLRQSHIAEEFAVSHIPVREALRQLDSDGLVSIIPHRGAVVCDMSASEFEELIRLRVLLEPELLRAAILNITAEEISAARKLLEKADGTQSVPSRSRLHWAFHAALYRPAALPETFGIVERLHGKVDRYLRLEATVMKNFRSSQTEHYSLLDYMETKATNAAVILLVEHIQVHGVKAVAFLQALEKKNAKR